MQTEYGDVVLKYVIIVMKVLDIIRLQKFYIWEESLCTHYIFLDESTASHTFFKLFVYQNGKLNYARKTIHIFKLVLT